ncbi:serine/threonine protein kinase [Pseudenhygromyxa sp. WMMC2535]|uniref:serine/threonine-protein kinase n=1 Tax=Pseudenhygromyxa sp. WMMC2535 TaxID=2712867 RepID=UPI001557B26D|nr:serine/threonine-protein kinase [Pseudenhygromyxa sp. WMMC2535]NVB42273.1 serine/threonine protein kinase [Pseudenhygromyxa sp. WMMC2535]
MHRSDAYAAWEDLGTQTLVQGEEESGEDSTPGDPPALDPLGLSRGSRNLGRYLLLGRLGRGGMGVVYAAYDQELDRKVAIKVLHAQSKNAEHRLVREAQAMARISHPNVAQIHEIGFLEGKRFVVMEFVEGETLRRWQRRTRRTRGEILAVFIAAGRGLAAVHDKGLVHRDFKPENVMIAEDGRVLVMDFGLAHGAGERVDAPSEGERASALADKITMTGSVLGTPAYMAPEQIEGALTDARSDQFSFCVSLWEALHSRRPFVAARIDEISAVVAAGKLESARRGEVPGWISKTLRRGLRADPDERWPSMAALLGALERDPKRRRWLLGGLAAICLVFAATSYLSASRRAPAARAAAITRAELWTCVEAGREIEAGWTDETRETLARGFSATGLSFAGSAWARTRRWMDDYAEAWSRARTQVCADRRLAEVRHDSGALARVEARAACLDERRELFVGLIDAWSEVDAQTVTLAAPAVMSLPAVSGCEGPSWAMQRVNPPGQVRVEVEAARRELGRARALGLAGKYGDGLAVAQVAVEQARALGWRPLQAEAWLLVGELQDELGAYEDAREALRAAYVAALAGGHDLVALEACAGLTLVVGDKLEAPELGLRWVEVGEALAERLALGGTIHAAELLYGRGLLEDRLGDDEQALIAMRRALAIERAELGDAHPRVARAFNGVGGVLMDLEDFEGALETQRRSLAIVEESLGPGHPEVARSLHNTALVLSRLGKHREALALQRRALEIREAALGPEHPDVAATYGAMGATMAALGDLSAAREYRARALEIRERSLGVDHPQVQATREALAKSP